MYLSTLLVCLTTFLLALLGTVTALPATAQSDSMIKREESRQEKSPLGNLYVVPKNSSAPLKEYGCAVSKGDDCSPGFPLGWRDIGGKGVPAHWALVSCQMTFNGTRYYGYFGAYYVANEVKRVAKIEEGEEETLVDMDSSGLENLERCWSRMGFYNSNGHEDGPAEDEYSDKYFAECIEIPKTYAGKEDRILSFLGEESKKELADGIKFQPEAVSYTPDGDSINPNTCVVFKDEKCEKPLEKNWRIPGKNDVSRVIAPSATYGIPEGAKYIACF